MVNIFKMALFEKKENLLFVLSNFFNLNDQEEKHTQTIKG